MGLCLTLWFGVRVLGSTLNLFTNKSLVLIEAGSRFYARPRSLELPVM